MERNLRCLSSPFGGKDREKIMSIGAVTQSNDSRILKLETSCWYSDKLVAQAQRHEDRVCGVSMCLYSHVII